MTGQTYVGTPTKKLSSHYLPPTVIAVSLIGAGLGLWAFLAGEPKPFALCALGIGIAAAVVQWSILLVVAIALILLITIILTVLNA